jgi:hypothetical protein
MNRRQTIAAFVTALVIGAALGTALPAIARSTGMRLPSDSAECSRCTSSATATATSGGACGSSACTPAATNSAPRTSGCPDCP